MGSSEAMKRDVGLLAGWMDRRKPDWFQHVNTETLYLGDGRLCVCGQNGLKWGMESLAAAEETGTPRSAWAADVYKPFWVEEIMLRRLRFLTTGMDIGEEEETYTTEPVEEPVPREEPAPAEAPAEEPAEAPDLVPA